MKLTHIAFIIGAVFWAIVYLLIIRRGFIDRTYGMPVVALGFNITWEFFYTFVRPFPGIDAPLCGICLLLDCVMVYQYLRFARESEFTWKFSGVVWIQFLFILSLAIPMMKITYADLNDVTGLYNGYAMNLMMSVLFCQFILSRASVSGQSIYIALFKLLGTLAISLGHVLTRTAMPLATMRYLFATTFIFDCLYVYLFYQRCRSEKIPIWSRI